MRVGRYEGSDVSMCSKLPVLPHMWHNLGLAGDLDNVVGRETALSGLFKSSKLTRAHNRRSLAKAIGKPPFRKCVWG